jgi:hypothetical protein
MANARFTSKREQFFSPLTHADADDRRAGTL